MRASVARSTLMHILSEACRISGSESKSLERDRSPVEMSSTASRPAKWPVYSGKSEMAKVEASQRSSSVYPEAARYRCAFAVCRADSQTCPDHLRTIFHNPQTQPPCRACTCRKPSPVVRNRQRCTVRRAVQVDDDGFCPSMLDRVGDRFLRNPVKMGRHHAIR